MPPKNRSFKITAFRRTNPAQSSRRSDRRASDPKASSHASSSHHPSNSFYGKVCVVTGANSGIGFHLAKNLAAQGCHTVLACRNQTSCHEAKERIMQILGGDAKLDTALLDLADFASIHSFVRALREKFKSRINLLVNNAGVWRSANYERTKQGFELTLGINHFGTFYLSNSLMSSLVKGAANGQSPSRVITIASTAHKRGKLHIGDWTSLPNKPLGGLLYKFSSYPYYADSKLCNMLFSKELNRRFRKDNVVCDAVHPGLVRTGIFRNFKVASWLTSMLPFILISSEESASAIMRMILSSDVRGGQYYKLDKLSKASDLADNWNHAGELWQATEVVVEQVASSMNLH